MSTRRQHLVKVEGTNFVRDTSTMGLSNRDLTSKNEYYMKVKMLRAQKDEINTVRKEMEILRTELSEIKNLIIQLSGKGKNG